MALAGLWKSWRSPAGEWMRSFAIITIEPNALCAELHNRMPMVLKPASWPVNARVGNVKNNDPSFIEPIAREAAFQLRIRS
jgi:putative SOS response-associated peptidase YedK